MNLSSWTPQWTIHSFEELQHLRTASMLETEQFSGHGVYLFTRRFLPPKRRVHTGDRFSAWINEELNRGCGTLSAAFSPHFALGSVQIDFGVSSMTAKQLADVKWLAWSLPERRVLRACLETAPPPVLYCGETAHFATRIRDHLDGSAVWNRLAEAGYGAENLDFMALPFPEVPDPHDRAVVTWRRSIERVLAQLTLAPFTTRPG